MVNFLEKNLLPFAQKIQNNKYISAVSDGFAMILPVIMIGAIFTLLASMQISPYQTFITNTGLKVFFGLPSKVTTDLLALYTVFGVAYSLSKKMDISNDAGIVGTISVIMLLLLIPMGVSKVLEDGTVVEIAGAINTDFLGAKGLFMAIIVGSIVPTIYNLVVKRGLVIKLPDSVPPTISRSFSALIPAFATAFVFAIVRFAFGFTPYGDANNFIYSIVALPLQALGNSPFAVIGFILFAQILWFFGLHGFMVILPFLQTIFLPLSLENLAAYEAGAVLPNSIVYQHFGTYVLIGGSGALLGLAILMAFTSKSQQYKQLGRLGLPGAIFGINEPIIFGFPMVLNTMMIIPFVLGPVVAFLIPYILQVIGILPTLIGVSLPLGTPVLMYGFFQGGFPIMIMQVILVIVQMLIWYPFFKIADNKAFELEQGKGDE
ncbi:MAG: PTS sugar transporter subunit IIC [Erysipelotrichaceae bacterium]|nr:PTS sugar transporter subunit IIC [Erysipelotrichaceae bacterium]